MDIHIHVEKRHLAVIALFVLVLAGALIVNAFGGTQPEVMGHSPGEIAPGVFGGDSNGIWRFPGRVGIGNKNPTYRFHISLDEPASLGLDTALEGTNGPSIYGIKKRGTQSTPLTIKFGDRLLLIRAYGYSGDTSEETEAARIQFESMGTIADGTSHGLGRVPGMIRFFTRPDASPPTGLIEAMRISANREVRAFADLKVDGKLNLNGAINVYKCPVHLSLPQGGCPSACTGQLVERVQYCWYPSRYNSDIGRCEIESDTCDTPVGKLIPN